MPEIHTKDEGIKLILEVGVDISQAIAFKIIYKNPDNTNGTWTAAKETATSISYTTQQGDLSIAGQWKIQAFVEWDDYKRYGRVANFQVVKTID
jgi:hypothetical protein